jgi:hypothetical protein
MQRDCNFEFARQYLGNLFDGTLIPKELAQLLESFIENPCADTAIEIIKFDPDFEAAFLLARKGGLSEGLFRQGKYPLEKIKERLKKRGLEHE